jgi:hypothetical protein
VRNILTFLVLLSGAEPSLADVLTGAQIVKIYAQSHLGSDAHMIQVDQTLSSVCNANRLYIDFDDKELFSSALANYLAGKPVDIIFTTTGAPRTASGHLAGITCRVISIF